MKTRAELKQLAKAKLGGQIFASPWLMLVLAGIIVSAIVSVSSFIFVGPFILTGPLAYGMMKYQQKLVKEDQSDLATLFTGFTDNFGQSLLLGLMISIFTALWSMLLVIPGIIASYRYSMAFYIQTHGDNKDWKHCLDESKRIMHGHKWELFVLDLSFIGWYLVGSLVLGIGTLFVVPYHDVTRYYFFEQLAGNGTIE